MDADSVDFCGRMSERTAGGVIRDGATGNLKKTSSFAFPMDSANGPRIT